MHLTIKANCTIFLVAGGINPATCNEHRCTVLKVSFEVWVNSFPLSIVLANFVVLVSEGPLPPGAVIIKADPQEVVVVIKARSGLLQVLEVRYVVYGGQVPIPLPAVLLSIGPVQLVVHVVVGFDRRQSMVAQEEPCRDYRQTADTEIELLRFNISMG